MGQALIDIDPATAGSTLRAGSGGLGPVTEIEFSEQGVLVGATGGSTSTLVRIDPGSGIESELCTHAVGALNGLEYVQGTLYGSYIRRWNRDPSWSSSGIPSPTAAAR